MKNKICFVILIVFILFAILPLKSVYASSISDIVKGADENFLGAGSIDDTIDEGQLQKTSNFVFKVLLAIGIVAMVLVGTIIGIKFMVASVEDKAKIKEILVPYIIGCVVILGAFTIWSTVVNIGQSIFPASSAQQQAQAGREQAIERTRQN